MSPSQKIGMTQMIVPYRRIATSTQVSRREPATTPALTPTNEATSIAPIDSSIVAGRRWAI